jgi:hypothetical protein
MSSIEKEGRARPHYTTTTGDDECNLINKEDFEEGKSNVIVTARATPIKSHSLVRKNMSTTLSTYGVSPSHLKGAVEYQDPNNPGALYY